MDRALLTFILASCIAGCSSATNPATTNRTFYEHDSLKGGAGKVVEFEQPFAALDDQSAPEFMGVSVFDGKVRFTRPKNWVLRAATKAEGQTFVQYISRNQYMVAVLDRPDLASKGNLEALEQYTKELTDAGSEVSSGPIPMATSNTQGRAFLIRNKNGGGTVTREYVLRGRSRTLIVQIAYQDGLLAAITPELRRMVTSLEAD